MSKIMKFFRKYLMTCAYEKDCYTDFSQFKKIVWDNQINDTIKAVLFKIYFKQSTDNEYIHKLLHLCSNECMANHVFAQQIIREKTHIIMFEKTKKKKTKWLMYSTLWNLFRFADLRIQVDTNFMNKILNDLKNIISMNDVKVFNVYIGCLSNLALYDPNKVLINNNFIKLNYLELNNFLPIEKISLPIFTSLFGLLCNISVDDDLVEILINSKIFFYIILHWNKIINLIDENHLHNSTTIRNSLSLLNNLMNNEKIIELFIKYNLFDSLLKIEIMMDNNDNFDISLITILPNIKDMLHVNKFSNTTNLHLANHWDKIHIILDNIVKNDIDINIIDNLGNTILHEALQNNKLKNAKYYILYNANINQLNNKSETPLTLNTEFVNSILIKKNKIHKEYEKKIRKKVNNEFYLKKAPYEKFIINEINNFIDIRPDIFNLIEN